MKKLLFFFSSILLVITYAPHSLASVQSISCSSVGDQSGCAACYQETTRLYTCNPYQSSCSKDWVTGVGDIAQNDGSTNLIMFDDDAGTINFSNLQSQLTWSMQSSVSSMYEAPAQYFTSPSAAGQCGWQHFTAYNKDGYFFKPGCSVLWTEMKSGAWLRPDLASSGASRSNPGYRVAYTPRFYTSETTYVDHRQCVYYYVRFCGDGTLDSDKGEQCDDGNMVSGDGCSNTCQTEQVVTPTCNSLTASPTTVTGTTNVTFTCSATNASSYQIVVRKPDNSILQTLTSASGVVSIPATPDGTYSAVCTINGSITSSACAVSVTNNEEIHPSIEIIKDDNENPHNDTQQVTLGGTASFTIWVRNNGTESLKNVIITDALAPGCDRSASQTSPLIQAVGNGNTLFDPGEMFSYVCSRTNVQSNTFPNQKNTICTEGTGNTSNEKVTDCDDTRITIETPQPKIRIIKDDADNYDDRQTIDEGGKAKFTIIVENIGAESLQNVIIDDPRAPDCNRSASQTKSLYPGDTFDPGESFTYTCSRSNVSTSTFPGDENVACVDARGNTSNIGVNDCDETRIYFKKTGNPHISIVKDDSDNHDDRQKIISGEVRFDIAVINDGDVSLEDVVIDDPRAPECSRSASQTRSLYPGNTFDPGEKFGYTCRVFNTDIGDFPGGKNEACVEGEEVNGSRKVSDCDESRVEPEEPDLGKCEQLIADKKFGQQELSVQFTCVGDAKDRYYLDILTSSGQILRTLTSSDGEFDHKFGVGDYIAKCRIDDELSSRSSCEQQIRVDDSHICEAVVSSNGSYGPAPFTTRVSCDALPQDNCIIEVVKRSTGEIVSSYNVCERDLTFKKGGTYDVRCVVNGQRDNRCSTPISVDSPTTPHTGGPIGATIILSILVGPAVWLWRKKQISHLFHF